MDSYDKDAVKTSGKPVAIHPIPSKGTARSAIIDIFFRYIQETAIRN